MIRNLNDNAIDTWVAHKIEKTGLVRINEKQMAFWRPVMERVVLSLSDQQLIAGLSILTAGFLKHCSISVYHFSIVGDLAWFSCNVHMTTLNLLNSHLRAHPTLRNSRVFLMTVMLIMMLAALVLQGHRDWYDSYNCDAQCVFDNLLGNISGSPAYWMKINICMLIYGYGGSFLCLYEGLSNAFILYFWTIPVTRMRNGIITLGRLKAYLGTSPAIVAFPAWLAVGTAEILLAIILSVYIAIAALLGSTVVSLYVDVFYFAYGVWGFTQDRATASLDMVGNENEMGFGQIVAPLLLASTIMTFQEVYIGAEPHGLSIFIIGTLLILTDQLAKERSLESETGAPDWIKPLADPAQDVEMTFDHDGPPVYPWEPEPVLRQRRVNTMDM